MERIQTWDVIVFPVVDWDFLFQRPQHLSVALSRRGHRVFYLSTKLEPEYYLHDLEYAEVAPSIWTVHLPGGAQQPNIYQDVPNELQISAMLAGLQRMREIFEIGSTVSLIDYPFWTPVAERLTNNVSLYDCMDDYASFANSGLPARVMEAQAVRNSDIAICSSIHLQQQLFLRTGRLPALIRNGVDFSHYETAPTRLALTPDGRTAGYWGATAEWTDIELLIHAALSLPDVRFVLIGDVMRVDVSRLAALPNVILLGRVPYESLPAYLHAFDVCLLPYRICEYALASDPMKVWEYMSAGKPVVAVRFPEIERLASLITLTSTPEEFVQGIREALSRPDDVRANACRDFARANTWWHRCEELCCVIEPLFPRISVIVLTFNQLSFTKTSLAALERFSNYPNLEVIVVDNGSSDKTPKFLTQWAASRPWAKIRLHPVNSGFAAGNNLGSRAATGEYLIFMNNDCFVTAGWIGDLLAHFRRKPKLGLLGPVTNSSGNESVIPIQYDSMEEMAIKARCYTRLHRGERTQPGVLHWFCVMIPRHVWQQVGELDESFGLGLFEDDDYTLRVRAAGFHAQCAEDVFIHHHHSATFGLLSPEQYDSLFSRNRQLFEQKWGPWIPPVFRKEMQQC